jgi:hypothetical protein
MQLKKSQFANFFPTIRSLSLILFSTAESPTLNQESRRRHGEEPSGFAKPLGATEQSEISL